METKEQKLAALEQVLRRDVDEILSLLPGRLADWSLSERQRFSPLLDLQPRLKNYGHASTPDI